MTKLGCTVADNDDGSGTASAWFSDGGTRAEIKLFAFDSTGLKPTNRGDWMTEKWGTRRGFIKLHVGVDAKTKKIYAVAITDDKCGDSPQFEELVGQALANAKKSPNSDTSAGTKAAADGAYDTQKIRRYCDEQGIEPLIPVRIDFAGKANGCMPRKEAGFRQLGDLDCMDKTAERKFAGLTREQKREFQKAWRRESGYNDPVVSRDCIFHVQAGVGRVHKRAQVGERQGRDIRKGAAVQPDDRYCNRQRVRHAKDRASLQARPKDCKGRGQDDDVGRIAQTSICVERN